MMKQLILNSTIGHIALIAREKLDLLHAVFWKTETVGTIANDQLASFLISKICLPNKVFIDVGAHIGSIISEVYRHDKSIQIIAFEAIPEKVSNLKRKFPFIEIHECAVGESEGEVSFFINVAHSGYSSLSRPSGNNPSIKEITTPLKKIDNLVSLDNVDAVKIDVEGAELGVIRGGEKLLLKCRPVIMFESSLTDNNLGYTKEDLWKQLIDLEYLILVPNRLAHNDDGLSFEGFLESHLYPRRTTNYFAVPIERRVEIRDRARYILRVNIN
jgi:FkbM family methyltransferase